MIKTLEVENFKAFGQRVRIDFAPITLIFGENSSGKSSILQCLNLLKQTRESREQGALLLPRAEQGLVDLGSFQEMIFDHDPDRTLHLRFDFDPSASSRHALHRPTQQLGIELQFEWQSEREEIAQKSIRLFRGSQKPQIAEFKRMSKTPDAESVGVFSDSEGWRSTRVWWSHLGPNRPLLRRTKLHSNVGGVAECASITTSSAVWGELFKLARDSAHDTVAALRENWDFQRNQRILRKSKVDREANKEVADAIKFYESEFTQDVFIKRMVKRERTQRVILDGFLPASDFPSDDLPELLFGFPRRGRPRRHAPETTIFADRRIVEAGLAIDQFLGALFPMGPFRRPPERWYIFTGTRPSDVGYRGDFLPDLLFRSPELIEEANGWLKKLGIGYEIQVKSIGRDASDLFELRLRDDRRASGVEVGLTDVGYGISQLLPFVVQCLASENRVISIEQPEVHVHPRLQADLGDLLAATIQAPRNHRFIVETHSEHLVLRLQRLVRQGTLKPTDVSVVFVSRGPEGSRISRLRMDEDGDFLDEWPGGFFPERLRELQ